LAGYKKHVFVCQHKREAATDKKACGSSTSPEIRRILKQEIVSKGLNKEIRINTSGCLGHCNHGPVMVIYPEGIWYEKVQPADLEEILNKSILDDKIIERLRLKRDDNEKTAPK